MNYDINNYIDKEEEVLPYDEWDDSWKKAFYKSKKPPSEIKLLELQKQYLKTRDIKIWQEMYDICFWYTRSMILKRCTGKMFFEPDEIFDKASAATMEFMQQYINNPYFEVGCSFGGLLKWKCVWILYKDKDQDQAVSLNNKLFDTEKEVGDIIKPTEEDTLGNSYETAEKEALKFDIDAFLKNLFDFLDAELDYEPRVEILVRLYILMYIKDPKSVNAKKNFIDRFASGDVKLQKALEYSIIVLHEQLKESAELN